MKAILHVLVLYILISSLCAYKIRTFLHRRVAIVDSRQYRIANIVTARYNSASHSSDEYLSVLEEQGISWSDLINMKDAYSTSSSKIIGADRHRSIKRVTTQGTAGTRLAESVTFDNQKRNPFSPVVPLTGVKRPNSPIVTERVSKNRKINPTATRKLPLRTRSSLPSSSTTGITLQVMLEWLVIKLGFPALHAKVKLNCFAHKPTVTSSLKVLRQERVGWARRLVEGIYATEKQRLQEGAELEGDGLAQAPGGGHIRYATEKQRLQEGAKLEGDGLGQAPGGGHIRH